VATATLVPSTGVAGIYNVATLPEARGQGIGAAMTATVLRAGRDLGCHTAILIASELGEPVYRRVGFEECCRVGEYVWQPDSSAG
jgi:predicted acetyltransferase